jgi:hypothetical protein
MQTKFHLPLLSFPSANLPPLPTLHAQKTTANVKIVSNRQGCDTLSIADCLDSLHWGEMNIAPNNSFEPTPLYGAVWFRR